MSWNSVSAGAALPLRNSSCRTFTNTSAPVRPLLSVTPAMVETRRTASPTRTGEWKANWLPAHIRRGSGTGGMKPPRLAWPSGPMSDWRCSGRKYNQCHSAGKGKPAGGRSGAWSSVAASAAQGVAVIVSSTDSVRPIQSCSFAVSVFKGSLS